MTSVTSMLQKTMYSTYVRNTIALVCVVVDSLAANVTDLGTLSRHMSCLHSTGSSVHHACHLYWLGN